MKNIELWNDCFENMNEEEYLNKSIYELEDIFKDWLQEKTLECKQIKSKAEAYDRLMSGGRKTLKEWANLLGMIFVVDQEGYGFAYKDTPVCYDEDGGWDSTTGVYFALIPPDLIDFNGDWKDSLTLPDGWETKGENK